METLFAAIITMRHLPTGMITEMPFPILSNFKSEIDAIDYYSSRHDSIVTGVEIDGEMEFVALRVAEFHNIRTIHEF